MSIPPHIAQRKKWYGTARWKRLRKRVLANNPICVLCHRAPATQADHVQHLPDNSTFWDVTNLRPVCKPCNSGRAHDRKAGGRGQTRSGGDSTDAGGKERHTAAQNRINELFYRLKENRNAEPNDVE